MHLQATSEKAVSKRGAGGMAGHDLYVDNFLYDFRAFGTKRH